MPVAQHQGLKANVPLLLFVTIKGLHRMVTASAYVQRMRRGASSSAHALCMRARASSSIHTGCVVVQALKMLQRMVGVHVIMAYGVCVCVDWYEYTSHPHYIFPSHM